MSGREEGFLSRWSRRKRGVLPNPEPEPEAAPVPEALPEAPAEAAPPVTEFDEASLPPLESLTGDSDFTAFLRPGVPAPLRQAALRRAWTLDPAIRDFIGPADYAWDYNAPDGVPGFALQLGGDVTRMLAQAIGALEDLVVPEEKAVPAEEEGAAPAAPAPPVALAEAATPPVVEVVEEEFPPSAAPVPPRRHGRAMPV